jgi:hypothetical protein
MMQKKPAFLLLLLLVALPAPAQPTPAREEDRGPYLGILFCAIPEALLEHLPQLPRDGGVIITHILPDSPAAGARLHKHDILVQFNSERIRDSNHLVRLIHSSKPGQTVSLILHRAGREMTLEAKLGLGPALKVAKAEGTKPPGVAKPGAPAPVTVTAVPVDGNRLKVTFEYSESGRIKTVTCSGDVEEIDREVTRLPLAVQSLARVAVKQLRKLDLQNSSSTRPMPR